MESEYEVLTHLQQNELTTQRNISKDTGLSLGAVNLLLKKMARKGLVKIEKLNARKVRYILTSKGMQEKSRLAYRFVNKSYRQILKISHLLDHLLSKYPESINGKAVILCGPNDEIMEILSHLLGLNNIKFKPCSDPDCQNELTAITGQLVLIWREEEKELGGRLGAVNVMEML